MEKQCTEGGSMREREREREGERGERGREEGSTPLGRNEEERSKGWSCFTWSHSPLMVLCIYTLVYPSSPWLIFDEEILSLRYSRTVTFA
jgi:hypothetical protein